MTLKLHMFLFAGLAAATTTYGAVMQDAQPASEPEPAAVAGTDSVQSPASGEARPAEKASAADTSTIVSNGTYVPPELKIVPRAAFGASAGKTDENPEISPIVPASAFTTTMFTAGAGAALLLTGVLAFGMSRTTRSDGSATRALTLGTKLALGFGTVVTGTLALSAVNSRSAMISNTAASKATHYADESQLVAEMEGDAIQMRLHTADFLASRSAEDLTRYSNAMAAFKQKVDVAVAAVDEPERRKKLEQIGSEVDEFHGKFSEAVKAIDEREAIIDDQMGPSSHRATELLEELARTAALDGDLTLANEIRELAIDVQLARLSFFKFLKTAQENYSKESVAFAEEAIGDLKRLVADVDNPRRKDWLRETTDAVQFWLSRMNVAQALQQRRNELVTRDMAKLGADITVTSDSLSDSIRAASEAEIARSEQATANAAISSTLIATVVALLGAVLAAVIARSVIRPISSMIARITEIRASNDLTRRVEAGTRDEVGRLGEAFNGMVQTLHDIIAEVKSGAVQIDAGGTQIASASQSMAQGASEQASSLQQISASLEEISGQTQQAAENARQANSLAQESKKSADRGQHEMAQMNDAVNAIKQSSGEISKIIKVIDEIAFQTNLLALNAAVEAARAGEAGKGFAVVAEEVRNLAQRSAEAAKSTSSMIEESVKRSENGVQIASRVGQALEEITGSTNKVNTLLAEIASAASEQAGGVSQINRGVSQLDQVTQQTAGNSEELASSAEELSSQVASLNALVKQFNVDDSSGPSVSATAKLTRSSHAPVIAPQPSKNPAVIRHADRTRDSASKTIPMTEGEALASF